MKKIILTLIGTITLSMSVQAEQFWADNSISLLTGSMYAEPNDFSDLDKEYSYSTVTLEHVSGHSWGGLFYFVDHHSGSDNTSSYIEISPNYCLKKMEGMVSSVNLAYTLETGGPTDNHLFGAGVDLKVPGMDYLGVTFYRAMNDGEDMDDNQITVVYGYSNGNITVDGFMDYSFASDNDNSEDNMHLNPQITYNLAPMLGFKNKFKVGIEYSYWGAKYGIDGLDQNAISLLLKAHL